MLKNHKMSDIKFGTDGWRAIIADEFTVENVARITTATGLWIKKNRSEEHTSELQSHS